MVDFGYKGRACELTAAQQDALKDWVAQTLPRTTTTVGEWIEKSYGVSYTRSALIKLLARMDVEFRKPEVIPRKLDPTRQQAFIKAYDNLLNNLGNDEAVLFADAVHPTHEVRPAGCWAPKDAKVALEQTSGRQRLNIHGAIDLETGATRMIEATTIDALSSIALLIAITLRYPIKRLMHVCYNVASFEWSRVVQRDLLSGQSGRSSRGFRARASQFDAQSAAFPDGLMWHRRSDSRPTVDGAANGPAHGSPSADCARVVRENEIQCPASDRRIRLSSLYAVRSAEIVQ